MSALSRLSNSGRRSSTEFIPLDGWDLSPIPAPRCTRLFDLYPVGIGTPDVESLASYFAELATDHSVSVNDLITLELIPRSKQDEETAHNPMKRNLAFNG